MRDRTFVSMIDGLARSRRVKFREKKWCLNIAMALLLVLVGSRGMEAQSGGTTGIDGLYIATQGTGSDIGEQINNLCSTHSAFNPTIELPAGTFSFSTTLNANGANCTIRGMGRGASLLHYTGSGIAEEGYNLYDLQLIGSGGGTGIVLNSPLAVIDNIQLGSSTNPFAIGMTVSSNAYLDRVSGSNFSHNTQNFYFPGAQTPRNSGENVVFDHVDFADGGAFTNCVQIGDLGYDGPQVTFYSPSFDGCQWANYDSAVTMYAPHFEAITPQSEPYGVTVADNYAGYPTNSTTLYNPQLFQNLKITAKALFEVEGVGVLNIEGMVDRTLEGPLVYLKSAAWGQPTLQIIAPDNIRAPGQLYTIAGGTSPSITILTKAVLNLNAPNGLMLNGNLVLPNTLSGTHGGAPNLQTSDSSGPSGDLPMYGPDGSLTDSGYGRTSYPLKTGTSSAPHVACWLNGGTLGQCITQPNGSGSCACR